MIFYVDKLTLRVFSPTLLLWPPLELSERPLAEHPPDEGNDPVAIFENGTGSENLIVCKSCITTFETLRNESLRRLPIAERTPSVLSING